MPNYLFRKEDGSIIELFFSMKEAPRIGERIILDDFTKAIRLASIPSFKQGLPNDIYDIDKLAQFSTPHETIGDTMERSRELSHKRAEENGGIDPIKRKFFDNYSKERKGKKHPKDV
jgi:hypothetical protein